jgi:clan AA aspartic protease
MREVRAKALVANPLKPQLHPIELDCLVDTGAVMAMLPRDVIEKLEIAITGKAIVMLANDQAEAMEIAGPLSITIGDRKMHLDCLVRPLLVEPLLGQRVLEGLDLDLIVDCSRKTLTPRPESPAYPSFKLKWRE